MKKTKENAGIKCIIKAIYNRIIPWANVSCKINNYYKKIDRAYKKRKIILSNFYCYRLEKKYKCHISPGAKIEEKIVMPHPSGVIIGSGSKIGKNVIIYQQVTIGQNHGKYPTIGNKVIIYPGAKIVGDIHIGNNCIIGANSVVISNIPSDSVVGGIPARIIKKYNKKDIYI